MGKLGKRARKFSRKNLQSVCRKKRKFNAMRENSRRRRGRNSDGAANPEGGENLKVDVPKNALEGSDASGVIVRNFFDAFSSEDEGSSIEDESESDDYLVEDPECPYISDSDDDLEFGDDGGQPVGVGNNNEMFQEIVKKREKIDRLRKKDPEFSKFLDRHTSNLKELQFEDTSSDEGEVGGKDDTGEAEELNSAKRKSLTMHTIDVWCWITLEGSMLSLPNLLNAFRAACHSESGDLTTVGVAKKEVYAKILTSVLGEADGIFRGFLGLSSSKVSVSNLSSCRNWLTMRPLIKSYLRSSLFLLKQLTENQTLAYTLSKLRPSILFFSAFPVLFKRFIKVSVRFWATGDKQLSASSYGILHDICTNLSSEWLDICLIETHQSFVARCKFVEPASFDKIKYLNDCLVELFSTDLHSSYPKVVSSLQKMAAALRSSLKTKNKDELHLIHSWQYICSLDLWINFISRNIRNHDLHSLLHSVIQIVMGIAHLFPGRRYFPLRIKCVQMLNQLSSASSVFIPIVYLLLEMVECRGNDNTEPGLKQICDFSSVLKVPKQLLKSSQFQEQCILSAVEQLSIHFAQWSCCISFPELVAIPLIVMKKFIQESTVDSHRRIVKRLIDQIENNRDFVERKRNEVSFSPGDQVSTESFLQFEKSNSSAPFSLYFRNMHQLKSKSSKAGGSTSRK
ncbi:noc2p family [Wolffia australiana]